MMGYIQDGASRMLGCRGCWRGGAMGGRALTLVLLVVCMTVLGSGVEGGVIGSDLLKVTPPSYKMTNNMNSMTPRLWGELSGPYPTNAWWGNLVFEEGTEVVAPLPYLVRAGDAGLQIDYPDQEVGDISVTRMFVEDLQIESSGTFSSRELLHYDELTVSMLWRASAGDSGMTVYLSRGSPYITASFKGIHPVIKSRFYITGTEGELVNSSMFKLKLNNEQTWIVYASKPTTFQFQEKEQVITTSEPFDGVIRVAVLLQPEHEQVLNAHSDVYPVGSNVQLYHVGDCGVVRFHSEVASMSGEGNQELLTLVLPHHIDAGATGSKVLENTYETIKGRMTGLVGDTWYLFEDLPIIQWASPHGIDMDKVPDIQEAIKKDQFVVPVSVDIYQFARQLAGLGRVALIADELGDFNTSSAIRERMKEQIEPWYQGTNEHELMYDMDWSGLVTKQSLENKLDDFGSAMYNDHHFQYGYFTYVAAVIGKEDPDWLNSKMDKVLELVRDYANPNRNDKYFPYARHFDFYMGHSWAGGLWVFNTGKNQESTSEAVNSYYSLYLLGLAMGNMELSEWGRILMAMEIRATKKYWHMSSKSHIYPESFSKNKMVGIMWSNKVDYTTWFGTNVEYIHCIQYLPFTPITEELLDAEYMEEAYPVVSKALTRPDPVLSDWWKGYIVMAHAIFDRNRAWEEAKELAEFDLGNTKTNTLYWIATRPSPNSCTFSGQGGDSYSV